MAKTGLIVAGVLVLAALGGGAALMSKGGREWLTKMQPHQRPLEVRMETVAKGNLVRTVSSPGVIEPRTKIQVSAQVLANVLRDSLGGPRAASDMLLPQADLTTLFPQPALDWLRAQGGRGHLGHRVGELERNADAWRLDGAGPFDAVVVAVAPYHLHALLPELAAGVAHFEWEPIVTCYLRYPPGTRLPGPMLGVEGGLAQWLFDRGLLCGQDGVIAAVISAHGRHLDLPPGELERGIHAEVGRLVAALPPPLAMPTTIRSEPWAWAMAAWKSTLIWSSTSPVREMQATLAACEQPGASRNRRGRRYWIRRIQTRLP